MTHSEKGVIHTFADAFAKAGPLANHLPLLFVLGAVITVLGALRLLRLIPRLNVNLFGRPDTPGRDGVLMVVIGAAMIVFGFIRSMR